MNYNKAWKCLFAINYFATNQFIDFIPIIDSISINCDLIWLIDFN